MNQVDLDKILLRLAENEASSLDKEKIALYLKDLSDSELDDFMNKYQTVLLKSSATSVKNPKLNILIKEKIHSYQVEKSKKKSSFYFVKMAAAITLMFALGVGLYNYVDSWASKVPVESFSKESLIDTASQSASLVSSHGLEIKIDSLTGGDWYTMDGVQLRMLESGDIEYGSFVDHTLSREDISHTISTPKGKMLNLILPDQTKVRLNALSSITYPMTFDQESRKVEMTGEVYFEVTKQRQKDKQWLPFEVHAKNQKVVVLGTEFNISAYATSELIETTLVEGKVHVFTEKSEKIMSPGQQVLVDQEGNLTEKNTIDIGQSLAWKEEQLIFNGKSIREIMSEIAAWYDVEVVYEAGLPQTGLGGQISKSKDLAEVLRLLELADVVDFNLTGDTIKVYKR